MKILVTGGNGFLGQHLCRLLKENYRVIATGKGEKRLPFDEVDYIEADITSKQSVEVLLRSVRPQVIIHTAAMSKPDECVQNREACIDINIKSAEYLLAESVSLANDIHFIYTSSDFVLGDNGPHDEQAIPAPLNFYGETKLAAEKMVAGSGLLNTIVRPVFMYGETWEGLRPTFLHWVKQNLAEGKKIKLVNDQFRTPTYVGDICKGIASIIAGRAEGLYHLAGEEVLTPYDMAVALARKFNLDTSLIEAVNAGTFPEPVRRAKRGGLVIDKAKTVLDFRPGKFEDSLYLI